MGTLRKTLYIDMDNVLVDFPGALEGVPPSTLAAYEGRLADIPNLFSGMRPLPHAVEAFRELAGLFDTYVLSTAPWGQPGRVDRQGAVGPPVPGCAGPRPADPVAP